MKRRHLSRMRLHGLFLREAQRERLVRIGRGEIEPMGDREEFFLWSLLDGHRPKPADFILPPLLFLAEQDSLERETVGTTGDEDEAATPADVTAS